MRDAPVTSRWPADQCRQAIAGRLWIPDPKRLTDGFSCIQRSIAAANSSRSYLTGRITDLAIGPRQFFRLLAARRLTAITMPSKNRGEIAENSLSWRALSLFEWPDMDCLPSPTYPRKNSLPFSYTAASPGPALTGNFPRKFHRSDRKFPVPVEQEIFPRNCVSRLRLRRRRLRAACMPKNPCLHGVINRLRRHPGRKRPDLRRSISPVPGGGGLHLWPAGPRRHDAGGRAGGREAHHQRHDAAVAGGCRHRLGRSG